MNEVKRILIAIKETAGDVFIATGLLPGIQKKWPEADIYFATERRFFDILKDNPYVKRVVEYHNSMLNYRNYESFGPQKNTFDIVYHPTIVTQHLPHWIHSGHGDYLGHVYAHLCDLDRNEYGPQYLSIEKDPTIDLPAEFVTIHARTNQNPKDYDYMQRVADGVVDLPKIQIGGKDDPPLQGIAIDLRGKTSPQVLAWVLKNAKLHVGLDSFPMHVAMYVDTPSVILFGGTYAKQGVYPAKSHLVTALEPSYRYDCVTSCHLSECEMKKMGLGKCIDNLCSDDVLNKVGAIIGHNKVVKPQPVTISAYMIIRDGIKYGFPFKQSIKAALVMTDEVVVVDGGSTDGTYESLLELAEAYNGQLKIYQHPWDVKNNPTLFGDEKTYARRMCKIGNFLIQLDADEFIHEPHPGALKELIRLNADADVMDLPVINFYGDNSTIRLEQMSWKWRIYRNDSNIIHGPHLEARMMSDDGRVVMDKNVTDGCEPIYADSLRLAVHKLLFPLAYERGHQAALADESKRQAHVEYMNKFVKDHCVVFHYSWLDLDRKQNNGEFWSATWHGQRGPTHNTAVDIASRIQDNKDILLKVDFDHPMKRS